MYKKLCLAFLLCFSGLIVSAEPEFTEKNINPLFIQSMPSKPWWNDEFKFRAPILVSETIGKKRENITLDFICDLGKNPGTVRIVTPWEEEVASESIILEDNKVEVIFRTSLREYENKPFFIYFGSKKPGDQAIDTDLAIIKKKSSIDIRNEKIYASFTTDDRRSGKIKTLRICGSNTPNQLTETKTGMTWSGFDLGNIVLPEKPVIKNNGPFKKTIEYHSVDLAIEFTIYSFSPMINFRITPGKINNIKTLLKWLAGGSDAYDTFYYEGLKGPMQFKAGPDVLSDKEDTYPHEDLTKWMGEGWASISDMKVNESVGIFFDRNPMESFNYSSSTINGGEAFALDLNLKEPVSGALVAIKGDWKEFRAAYIDWKNPPAVSIGAVQSWQKIAYRKPDFTKDFTRDYKFQDGREGQRLSDDFAEQMILNIRRLGGNAAKFNISNITSIPMSEKLYEKYVDIGQKYYYYNRSVNYSFKAPPYEDAMSKDTYLQRIVQAAHAKGMPVRTWNFICPFFKAKKGVIRNKAVKDFTIECLKAIAATGVDLLQTQATDEWSHIPPELDSKDGRTGAFWENADAWFTYEAEYTGLAERIRKEIKKDYPALPINSLCSMDGWLRKMDFIDDKAPFLDTIENEFCPGMIPNMPRLKYGIKRMQGAFGNDGRSIQAHFYYYEPDPLYRVSEMELPMIFGVKSFSHETIGHDMNNPELNQITADFYRLTDYTALDKFMASTVPYKFMAVFRDSDAFRDDIRNKRITMTFSEEQGEQEARCKQLTVLKNIPTDVIFNRFFTVTELEKYKIVFIPSDRVLRDEYAEALKGYVQSGGLVISEGNTIDNKIFSELAGVEKTGSGNQKFNISGISMTVPVSVKAKTAEVFLKTSAGEPLIYLNKYGKGKVLYSPSILTDDMNNSREKELFVRSLITRLAGTGPLIPEKGQETAFDSSLLVSGKEYFLGVYNPACVKKLETTIKVNIPIPEKSFLLNVKTGKKTPFEGTVKTDIAPLQTGFYIIGQHATDVPVLKTLPLSGGASLTPGMKFPEKKNESFSFEFTAPGKAKILGILHITDRRGRQHQAWGAEAIYNCLKNGLPDLKLKYLDNLEYKTINGCDAVIVPNMGPDKPYQLNEDWARIIAEYAGQGGGVMLMHHAIGVGELGGPPFPSIGKWSGNYYAVNRFSVAATHPVTKEMMPGDIFNDNCWDYDQLEAGEDGTVIAVGLRPDGVPTPAMVAGKYGKGNIVLSGIGIGCGYKKEGKDYIKYEAPPEGGLRKILLNSAEWLLK